MEKVEKTEKGGTETEREKQGLEWNEITRKKKTRQEPTHSIWFY